MVFESYRNIIRFYSVQSWMGCSTYLVHSLSQTECQRFTSQRSFQQIKKKLSDTLVVVTLPWLAIQMLLPVWTVGYPRRTCCSTHQTISAYTEKDITSEDRCQQTHRCQNSVTSAHCIERQRLEFRGMSLTI